jgi:hypothetical protein
MRVYVVDLEGDEKRYTNVNRIAFTNNETFGAPEPVIQKDGEKLILINANGYTSIVLDSDS